jgi:hypothetical protein
VSDPGVAALAMDPRVALLFLAWGFAEATAAPIVPDVGLGFLALATPAALGLPLASAIAGGVVGALALVVLRQRRPDLVDRILAFQPGLGATGMAETRVRIAKRGGSAFGQVGPGLPLKAYVVAYLHDRPATGFVEIAGLAFLNRLTRVVPTVAAFALLGYLARPLDLPAGPVALVYALGWILFYAAFWWIRRPGDRPYEHL